MAKSFGTSPPVNPSTLTTSRKCYFTVSTGTAFTIPADTEIEFNSNGIWLNASGNTPAGAKWWRCRFTSSESYNDITAKAPTLNSVSYPFTIITMTDPALVFNNYTGFENYTETGNYVD